MSIRPFCALMLSACLAALAQAAARDDAQVQAELGRLFAKVKGLKAVDLPAKGVVMLAPKQSVTVETLRGVPLDDDPPVLNEPAVAYDAAQGDGFAPGKAPYVARDIKPFRFRYFNNMVDYGGKHNFPMQDYALAHGFSVLRPWGRKPEDSPHLPKGTVWAWPGPTFNWPVWMEENKIGEGRYDLLAGKDLAKVLLEKNAFARPATADALWFFMGMNVLPQDKLREQPWYPKSAAERARFEKNYYDGYAAVYLSSIQAARRRGWQTISLDAWAPYAKGWFGLEKAPVDPAGDHPWNTYGKRICEQVDVINHAVTMPYMTPGNVAFSLAYTDNIMRLIGTLPVKKPVRTRYSLHYSGGGPGWRWWAGQPMGVEEARALAAMAFFTGFDGLMLWGWNADRNPHVADITPGREATVGRQFECKADGAGKSAKAALFEHDDVIHFDSVDAAGIAHFQKVQTTPKSDGGVGQDYPAYVMPTDALRPCLRAASEPVSAFIEGMALAKPFEYVLRHGQVRIDVTAQDQFFKVQPIVRQVQLGRYHVVATYDPQWQKNQVMQSVELKGFDGRKGLTVLLPADSQTRIFVLRQPE